MTTTYMEWGSDLVVSPNGGLLLATGWDEVRQRIERRMLTNQSFTLLDGSTVVADYIFDVNYGVGLRRLVDQTNRPDFFAKLKQLCLAGVQADIAIDTSVPPTVVFQSTAIGALFILVGVQLATGQQGKVAFQVQ